MTSCCEAFLGLAELKGSISPRRCGGSGLRSYQLVETASLVGFWQVSTFETHFSPFCPAADGLEDDPF